MNKALDRSKYFLYNGSGFLNEKKRALIIKISKVTAILLAIAMVVGIVVQSFLY